jgi:hypothetical protein
MRIDIAVLRNWVTTLIGVIVGCIIIFQELFNSESADIEKIFLALGLLGIGAAARDGDKSSRSLGLK